jgi:plasmid replication initiation protein
MTVDEVLTSPLTLKELEATKSRKKELGDVVDAVTLHTLPVREYAEFCGVRLDSARQELLEASETLFNRYIHIKHEDGKSFIKFRWVSSIRYDAKEDTVSLRWSVDILPYITQLTEYFTKLRLNDLLELQSTYSWKLYTILKSHKGENNFKKEVTISVEDLIFELAVPDSCKDFKMLNSRILQKATSELKKKALPDLKMTLNKKGKKVSSVSWHGVPTTRFMSELVKGS